MRRLEMLYAYFLYLRRCFHDKKSGCDTGSCPDRHRAGHVLVFFLRQAAGSELVITRGGKVFGTYSLAEDRTIEVKQDSHINKITYKNGQVSMSFSDCHGQDCVQQHSISRTGESIVMPANKVMLDIQGGKSEYDSMHDRRGMYEKQPHKTAAGADNSTRQPRAAHSLDRTHGLTGADFFIH